MREGPNETSSGNHGVEKIHSHKKTVMINDGVDRLDSRSSASGWTASDIEAEERQAISSYRSKRLEEASAYFQRKLTIEDDEEDFPVRSLRNVTGPLKEVMLTLFQGPNEVHALEFLKDCGVRNEATKTDLLSILKSEHLTTRDHQYIMECFTLMKEAGRRDSETSTDLPNDGSSSSGSSSDKRSDKRCSSHGNKRRRGSSDANSVSGGSSAVNSGRRGSSRGNSRKSVSFGKDPMWGGPPAGLNSSGKSSLTGNSVVEDLGSRRTYSTQFASDEDFRIFDEEDLYVDNGCSIGNTVGGSTILDFFTVLSDKINNTSSGPKLQNLREVYSKDASSDTTKNKMSQIFCRRSVKSRLPGFSNILELYASPVFQDPDLNVVSTHVEVQLSKQNDCSRVEQLLATLVESLASDAQAAPTPSGDSMHGRLEVPLASSIDKAAPTLSCDIMIGTHEDPPASSIDKAAPALSCDIMIGTYEDPPASSFEKPNPKTSNEIVGGRLDDPLASSYSEAVQIPSAEFTPGRPDDLLASSVGEVAPTPSGDIMAGRRYDPLISSNGVAAEARLPEHSKIPYEPGHWKDLPADIFKCPIRFFEAVEENLKDRVSGYLEEIEKLHEYKPVTTIAMLWQLRYLGIELADIRDNREDIDYILGSFGELSQLQNVAVKRLLDFLKVFDDQLMAVLKKAVDKTEDKLPPLWREVEQHGEKSYVTAYAALRFKKTISSRIKKSFRVERGG